jgi:hypothetical protein
VAAYERSQGLIAIRRTAFWKYSKPGIAVPDGDPRRGMSGQHELARSLHGVLSHGIAVRRPWVEDLRPAFFCVAAQLAHSGVWGRHGRGVGPVSRRSSLKAAFGFQRNARKGSWSLSCLSRWLRSFRLRPGSSAFPRMDAKRCIQQYSNASMTRALASRTGLCMVAGD